MYCSEHGADDSVYSSKDDDNSGDPPVSCLCINTHPKHNSHGTMSLSNDLQDSADHMYKEHQNENNNADILKGGPNAHRKDTIHGTMNHSSEHDDRSDQGANDHQNWEECDLYYHQRRGLDKDEVDHDWKEDISKGGSLQQVALEDGSNGWASPPGELFLVRGPNYFSKKQKVAAGPWLLKPLGVDWLKSKMRLDHVLSRPENRVAQAILKVPETNRPFVFAVNLQVPGREHHSAVFYFYSEDAPPKGSLLHRFVHEDDAFRNNRFKLINRIVRGPWIVRTTVGNHAACLLGKALTCHYICGPYYFEIDVDIGSSALASAIVHLALGYVSSVTVDMGFLIESQTEEELPERLLGAVRIAQIQMGLATTIETSHDTSLPHLPATSSWKRISKGLSFMTRTTKHEKAGDEGQYG